MSSILSTDAKDDTPQARGRRFKLLRGMLGLTRNDMADKIGYSRASISYWENATYNGLMYGGAEKAVDLARKYGVSCTTEWLMTGLGDSPHFVSGNLYMNVGRQQQPSYAATTVPIPPLSNEENSIREKEIANFKKLNPDAVVLEVHNMNVAPMYVTGQMVGGVWQPIDSLTTERFCLVEIKGTLQIRRIRKSNHPGLWDALLLQPDDTNHEPLELIGIKLTQVAPITRVWG